MQKKLLEACPVGSRELNTKRKQEKKFTVFNSAIERSEKTIIVLTESAKLLTKVIASSESDEGAVGGC